MPSTSAATERSFSTQATIHTKRRNRLTAARATKLNYIKHNNKLLTSSSLSTAKPSIEKIQVTNATNVEITDKAGSENDLRQLANQNDFPEPENELVYQVDTDESDSDEERSWHSGITGNGSSGDEISIIGLSDNEERSDENSNDNVDMEQSTNNEIRISPKRFYPAHGTILRQKN